MTFEEVYDILIDKFKSEQVNSITINNITILLLEINSDDTDFELMSVSNINDLTITNTAIQFDKEIGPKLFCYHENFDHVFDIKDNYSSYRVEFKSLLTNIYRINKIEQFLL